MSTPSDPPQTPYLREDGYARRYRDLRFATGSGRGTHRREVRAVRRLLRGAGPGPAPWLDLPSGAGRLSDLLPGPVVQVDRELSMLDAAPGGHRRVCASGAQLPFAADTFAGALCMRLLQHIPSSAERIAILVELRRVTRGPIIVSFFHSLCAQNVRRALARRFGKRRSGRSAISLATFCRDAAEAGLRPAKIAALAPFLSDQWLARLDRA